MALPLAIDVPRERFPPEVEATIWFVSCEGVANAVKHADAETLGGSVSRDGGSVHVEIFDDGRGGAVQHPGGGLQGLADRVAAVGGQLRIDALLRHAGIEVVAAVDDAEALIAAVDEHEPDVAVIDIRMPPTHTDEGLRAAWALRRTRPLLPVLLLSQWVQAGQALDLFRSGCGGLGYLLKDRVTDIEDFLAAVQRVARGSSAIDPQVVAALLTASRTGTPLSGLTERERDVLSRMAEGRSNAAIADQLSVSRKTVETHSNSIFSKLCLEPDLDDNRRVLAVLTWLRSRA